MKRARGRRFAQQLAGVELYVFGGLVCGYLCVWIDPAIVDWRELTR